MSPRIRRSARPFPPDETLPEPPRPAGLVLDAQLHLLDRQTLDVDGVPVSTVDDLEIGPHESTSLRGSDTVHVTGLLYGPVSVTRVFGGRPPASRLHRVDWRHVTDVGTTIRLGVHGDSLDVLWLERWVRDRVIGRIPGGRHDPR